MQILHYISIPPISTFPLTILFGVSVAYYIGWIIYTRFFHPLAKIPGPFLASITRFWYVREVNSGSFDKKARELHQKYGYVVRICPNEIIVSDPAAIKTIYGISNGFVKTDFYPPMGAGTLMSKYGDHFSRVDEKMHSQRRRLVNNIYSLSSILESEQYVDSCSNLFMSKMGEFARDGRVVDLGVWLQYYAFDVIGQLYFGKMFGFMERSEDVQGYIANIDQCFDFAVFVAVLPSYIRPLISLLGYAIMPSVRRFIASQMKMLDLAKACVRERQEQLAMGGGGLRRDMLAKFLEVHREKGEKADFQLGEIHAECMTGIMAGSDTTAIALRAILYYLTKNPEKYAKLTAEIDEADKNGFLCTPSVKYADATKLPYLVACCKEGMRMHPSVGMSYPRIVPKGGCVIAGYHIPEGCNVGMAAATVHYDKDVFGPDANQFNPDRWLTGNSANMDRHNLEFGFGSRTCIGKNISLSEIYKLIPQFIRNYRIVLVHPESEWHTKAIWFTKQTGFEVRITKRVA